MVKVLPRAELLAFQDTMAGRLSPERHDYEAISKAATFLALARNALDELEIELNTGNADTVTDAAADVANFALLAAHHSGALSRVPLARAYGAAPMIAVGAITAAELREGEQ